MDPIRFDISGYCITLCCTAGFVSSVQKNVVYLPVVEGDGRDVWSNCENLAATDFALVCITGLDWNNDLSPWESEGVFSADAPFGGNASATLQLITGLIAPVVERTLAVQNPIRTIAGYSLGGLFALWSLFNCSLFQNAVSASGSLWFPGINSYFREKSFPNTPSRIYFSLGKKETRTPSRLLCGVADATQTAFEHFSQCGIECVFEWNPGNHFKDPDLRTAKGIAWVLH